MNAPTRKEYEDALDVIDRHEKRQAQLRWVKRELGRQLSKFDDIKFRVYKNKGEIIFAGLLNGKVKLGVSKCSFNDVFNEDIGKLIAVLRATNQDIESVVKLVEGNPITAIAWNPDSTYISTPWDNKMWVDRGGRPLRETFDGCDMN